jgi:hypothetical protein
MGAKSNQVIEVNMGANTISGAESSYPEKVPRGPRLAGLYNKAEKSLFPPFACNFCEHHMKRFSVPDAQSNERTRQDTRTRAYHDVTHKCVSVHS